MIFLFGEKEMSTMVEEWIAEGEVKGKAEGKAESILLFLSSRFQAVPASLEERIKAITNVDQLDDLTRSAATCGSLEDFERTLGR